VQQGLEPADFKPMPAVGSGVYELRIRAQGAFRVFHVAKFAESIYVIHVFQKKTQATAALDVEVGAMRYRDLVRKRRDR
jgi:phage-related protein